MSPAPQNDSSKKQQPGGITGPAVMVILLAIFGYLTFQPSLTSIRPEISSQIPGPPTPKEMPAVFARLWQDPFTPEYKLLWETPESTTEKSFLGLWSFYSKLQKQETRIPKFFKKIVENTQERLLFMPVLLPGGPNVDAKETRIRIRYAVLTALASQNYVLQFPRRITYVNVKVDVDFDAIGQKLPSRNYVVPVRLLAKDDIGIPTSKEGKKKRKNSLSKKKIDRILICWLNEEQFGSRPMKVISQIFKGLFSQSDPKDKIQVAIIGPSSSDGLLSLAFEWNKGQKRNESQSDQSQKDNYFSGTYQPKLYSPRATIWPQILNKPKEKLLNDFFCPKSRPFGLQVVRTIGTDFQLVEALCKELKKRKAWPDSQKPDKNRIVLITEMDTLYGRALPKTFHEKLFVEGLHQKLNEILKLKDEPDLTEEEVKNLLIDSRYMSDESLKIFDLDRDELDCLREKTKPLLFYYLRGLDGKLPDRNKNKDTDPDDKSSKGIHEVAQGRSQYDYLRRIQNELFQWQRKLRAKGGEIKAIGVVGTDVYDKLLVLRALRRDFPRAWFFTTDLDAVLTNSLESKYTRNLLVASHFGLHLKHKFQIVPEFRDSYQTAIYLSCLLAVENPDLKTSLDCEKPWCETNPRDQHLQPLVFELGRSGPYRLTPLKAGNANFKIHPANNPDHLPVESSWVFITSFIVCLLAFLISCIAPKHLWFVSVPILVLVIIGIISWNTDTPHWEWYAGTMAGIACLACVAFYIPRSRAFLLNPETAFGVLLTVAVLSLVFILHEPGADEPLTLTEGISVWPATILRYIAFLMAIFFLLKSRKDLNKSYDKVQRMLDPNNSNASEPDDVEISQTVSEGNFHWFPKWKAWVLGIRKINLGKSIKEFPGKSWQRVQSCGKNLRLLFLAIGSALKNWWQIEDNLRSTLFRTNRIRENSWEKLGKYHKDWVPVSLKKEFEKHNHPLPQRNLREVSKGTEENLKQIKLKAPHNNTFLLRKEGDFLNVSRLITHKHVFDVYREAGGFFPRLLRSGLFTLLYFGFGFLLFCLTNFPFQPYRGDLVCWIDQPILYFAVIGMMLLVFFVIDTAQLCRRFVRALAKEEVKPPPREPIVIKNQTNQKELRFPDPAADRRLIRTIAEHTKAVSNLIYYPVAVTVLIALSRHPAIDNFDFPWALIALLSLNLMFAVIISWNLRKATEKAREDVVARLEEQHYQAVVNQSPNTDEFELAIRQIQDEQKGAFRPLVQDPLFLAFAIPFGGVGGLLVVERLISYLV